MDLDAFRWLLTDEGQAAAGAGRRGDRRPGADELARPGRAPAYGAGRPRRRGAHPGRAARAGGAPSSATDAARMYFTAGRARAGHPALRWPPTGPAACRRAAPERRSTSAAGSAATWSRSRGPGSPRPGSTSTRCGWPWPRPTSPRSAWPGAVQEADATQVDLAPFDVAFADPARRSGRGRTFDVEDWTPPWTFVEGLLRARRVRQGRARASRTPWCPHGVEAEWVSDGGEVKEAALWSGAARHDRPARDGDRRGGLATLTDEDDPGPRRSAPALGGFLYEPDGAVIRAGLVTAVAAGVDGRLVDAQIAYVTVGRVVPHAVRARPTGCSRSCPTARSRCGPRCGRAASAR